MYPKRTYMDRDKNVIITIDGPSGAGKGTVAHYLAEKYNLHKLDTGLLYRALAAILLEKNICAHQPEDIIEECRHITLDDIKREGLRQESVAALASKIAAIPEVRAILLTIQQDFAYSHHEGYNGVILDGRDTGTAVCPDATCKIYLTASEEVRAFRRSKEEKGPSLSPHSADKIHLEKIQSMMAERDKRDSSRATAPLNVAPDAFLIDTSHLTIDEVCAKAAYYIENLCLSSQKYEKMR